MEVGVFSGGGVLVVVRPQELKESTAVDKYDFSVFLVLSVVCAMVVNLGSDVRAARRRVPRRDLA